MPGVYLEYIKAGKFVVPVELTFQTETISVEDGIRGLVNTSKWVERHNWKEIKAMLKPAVEACLKFNETPLEKIPKSHHITYGENVSLGYLIVANKLLSPFFSVLNTKKNCWSEDEEDEDELLGLRDQSAETDSLDDHGGEFTECIPTNTAIRVCVVKKSIVSIDDARRIRKELGVRSEDVRQYFTNEPGTSHNQYHENNQQSDRAMSSPKLGSISPRFDEGSDSEAENIPRTYGDPEEIRDVSRMYNTSVIKNRDLESDDSDNDSLPDIEPHPVKKKRLTRTRKKSASLSPSKAKRLTHNTILAVSQEGHPNFSEEDSTYSKRKKSKRKRTVAVVEPMRTLPNGQMSFEHAIGAFTDRRRKGRPNSSHGADKGHSSRSKQLPAIDIIAPDDNRLTITNPPEPIPVIDDSTSTLPKNKPLGDSPAEQAKKRKEKQISLNINEDIHKWDRLTPSPFNDEDDEDTLLDIPNSTYLADSDSDSDMPVLSKEVLSDEETMKQDDEIDSNVPKEDTSHTLSSTDPPVIVHENSAQNERTINTAAAENLPENSNSQPNSSSQSIPLSESHNTKKRAKRSKPVRQRKRATSPGLSSPNSDVELASNNKNQSSPDITQIKTHATIRRNTFRKRLTMTDKREKEKSSSEFDEPGNLKSKAIPPESQRVLRTSPQIKKENSPVKQSPGSPTLSRLSELQPRHSPRIQSPAISPRNLRKPDETADQPLTVERPKTSPSRSTTQEIFGRPKTKRKSKMRRGKKQEKNNSAAAAKSKMKPVMGDAQTQTDDLSSTQIERRSTTPNLISNALVKLSRCYDESSEDELNISQRSWTPLLPDRMITATPIHHPALGSPKIDVCDEEGLFSFESPTVPVLMSSQSRSEHSPMREDYLLTENSADTSASVERSPSPQSPRPGCSHWERVSRSVSPPIITDLMPPPVSRPPRTHRKMIDDKSGIANLSNDELLEDSGYDTMPMGAEASTVIRRVGRMHHLMNHSNVYSTGMSLIEKITKDGLEKNNRNSTDDESFEDSKALVPISTQRKRDLSPDICELVPGKKHCLVVEHRKSRIDNHSSKSRALVATNVGALQLREEDARHVDTPNNSLLMDLANTCEDLPAYEPRGDEFDLSQRSLCMRSFVSEYDRKSRLCKIHAKIIQDTNIFEMKEHFKSLISDLYGIYRGTVPSERHNMYSEVQNANLDKQDLQDRIFASPFTTEQITTMYEQIRKHFPRGDSDHNAYNDYVSFVLMPETLIRLYSKINQVPYPIAETELQYQACYEGQVSDSGRTSLQAIE